MFVWCAGRRVRTAGNIGVWYADSFRSAGNIGVLFGVQVGLDMLAIFDVWCAGSIGSAGDSGASKFPAPVGCHHVHVLASSSLCDENRRQRHNAGDFTYCPALSFSSARVLLL